MNRFSTLALIASIATAFTAVALSPRSALVSAPSSVLSTVDSLTRLDMIDYYEAGHTTGSRNALGGNSMITRLDEHAVTVKTSSSSSVTIALLPTPKDTLLLVVNEYKLPATDSKASVYDRNWKLANSKVQLPDHNDLDLWTLPQARQHRETIENKIPFVPARYDYNDGTMVITNTLDSLLSADDYKTVSPYIRPSINYRWDGKKWSLTKL